MKIGDWIELGSVLVTLGGLYFIYKQYKISNEQIKISNEQTDVMHKQIKAQDDIVKREKAIEVAEKFCDLLDNQLGFLSNYFEKIKMNEILSSIKYSDLEHFDICEYMEVFNEELRNSYTSALEKVSIKEAADSYVLYSCGTEKEMAEIKMFSKLNWKVSKELKNQIENFDEVLINGSEEEIERAKRIFEFWANMQNSANKVRQYYFSSITQLLNKLEYMSMLFKTELADEEIVYQSLHQVYLSVVKSLYGAIANANTKQPDKYYCNVVWLYKKWAIRHKEKTLEEISITRQLEHESKYVNSK